MHLHCIIDQGDLVIIAARERRLVRDGQGDVVPEVVGVLVPDAGERIDELADAAGQIPSYH
ncbi:MAG: hypothetical protein LUO89_01735, partial [Methanothrix sp.]|nr:hypothetical protein [Methanothrix sp.]